MALTTSPKKASPVNIDERQGIALKAGDTVRVHQKIKEGGKIRIQVFEGLVLGRKHGNEPGATFTVRATLSGIGVEKIFPLYSPAIDKIEVLRRTKVRRSKLGYIREKAAREVRRQLRNMVNVSVSTSSEREEAEKAAKAAVEAEAVVAAEAAAKAKAEADQAQKLADETQKNAEVETEEKKES